MRDYLGLPHDVTGILIDRIEPLSLAAQVLRAGDVLTEIDGVPVADDGTISFLGRERINFSHLVSMKFPGESAQLRIYREGKAMLLRVETVRDEPPLASSC